MKCDVAVVGAGPAGSSCAYRLARAGYAVVIIEKSIFPRTKVCGEYVSAAARAQLNELGIGESVLGEAAVVRRIRLHTEGIQVELPFCEPAWSIARSDLDELLLAHALGAGVTCIFGRVEACIQTGGVNIITLRDPSGKQEDIEARVLVGADGMGSVVARDFDLSAPQRGQRRFALGGHYSGFGGLDQTIEMYVRGSSYFAINPLGEDIANVMVIVDEQRLHEWSGAIDERLQEAACELSAGRRNLQSIRLVGKRVAVGPLAYRTRAPAQRGVYLIGDAAGFLDPFTGQGVFLALKSASLAAGAIASESIGAHKTYNKAYRTLFSGRQRVASFVSTLIKTPGLRAVAAHNLRRSPRLRERLMQAVTGAT